MLNASDITSLRADMALMLLDTCDLRGRTGSMVSSAVPCSVAPEASNNRPGPMVELNMGIMTFILTVPYNTTLTKDLRVVHGGHEYEIDELLDDQTPLICKRARMTRVTG